MTILETIENDSNEALRNSQKNVRILLSTLIGEIKMLAKNSGNRDANDEDSIKVIRKFIKSAEESISIAKFESVKDNFRWEISTIQKYLPVEVSENDIGRYVNELLNATYEPVNRYSIKNMGVVMSMLKQRFGSALNPSLASKVVKTILS